MKLKYLLILSVSIIAVSLAGCTKDEIAPTGIKTKEPGTTTDYTAPTYGDDYSAIASWSDRSQWNLANVHDPSVVFDGTYYYMYSTDASYGNAHVGHGHFLARRSKDLVHWDFIGMAMSTEPAWVKDTLNNMRARVGLSPIDSPRYGFWAPVIRKVGNKYRMYYSVVVDNYIKTGKVNTADNFDGSWTEKAFIGMMETSDLSSNQWVDHGMVVCSVSDRGTDWSRSSLNDWSAYFKYNAIDPSMIVTPEGENWLIYGSWHSGIVAIQLNPDTGLPLHKFDINDESTWGTQIYTRTNGSRWQASEGPEIMYNAETGYYYLFLAYDELSVAYNTRVCRARSITGPYYSYDGSTASGSDCFPIITHPYKFNNHSGWVGFSHCCVFKDETNNQWYYCSQARLPANTNGNAYSNAIMMGHVRKIEWTEDGWPAVLPERYAAVPQDAIAESDLTGSWEVITLNYHYKKQQTSSAMTLSSDHKATGAVTGTWSYNSTTGILTVGSLKLNVVRELDWEASPRVPTIVFTGLNGSGRSVWGKKSQS
ncbi:arabinan endo-1,5-alpha-L-arabinosidase [Prolixibacter sp. NT017]|uniref:arabinan endo-1,5-alpha-L-arabinosidase n=1 Tax=Prolixibacter sp. NT017 TaxID=2652390 RepID=UPI00127A0450|nr:arabinan endo-1,5-alpha-L-arabinosidase [Prolixibacter sp. NT017]GET26375.1 arabinan endo-1,5-alpha-L-arabinosidase [Prolixibacter sp. NT017]